jgi:DNA-binding NtrC family response regulator
MMFQPGKRAKGLSCRPTILLVEDEPFVRAATCSILESLGFEVLPAEDAQQAMMIYEHCGGKICLLMTDMVLPGQSGQQLGCKVRERSPEVYVLVTSGYGRFEYEAEMPEARTYFLAKPYSKCTLLEKIEKILGSNSLKKPPSQAIAGKPQTAATIN